MICCTAPGENRCERETASGLKVSSSKERSGPRSQRVRRNIEAFLLPIQDGVGQLPAHQLAQDMLLARPAYFQMVRQRSGELDDAMIEERRPQFQSVSHAHAVGLHQNVVRQEILLIEPKVAAEAAQIRTLPIW